MHFDPTITLANVRDADTDDLIDRVTAYRAGMEPVAVELIEGELHRRGVDPARIEARRSACARECVLNDDGSAVMCRDCRRPAVARVKRWFRLLGALPVFPMSVAVCEKHRPAP